MEANTSTEFMDWWVYLDMEWETHTKQDFYLAQLAAEVRRMREGWMEKPKPVSTNDCLLQFGTKEEESYVKVPKSHIKQIEIGSNVVETDPKWASVNTGAKSIWAQRLGM